MFSQLFGRYLVDQKVITDDELRGMIQKQGDERLKLGTIAVAQGLMTEQQVAEVNHLQVQMDKRFGDIAVERGYLSGSDVGNLLSKQGNICMKFLQILSEQKKISLEDCNRLVSQFQKYYGFSDDELEALKQNDFDEIAPAFVYASKPYVTELSALVMRNLVRFVTDNFYIGKVKHVDRFFYKSMVAQKLVGDHNIILGFAADEDEAGIRELAEGFAQISLDDDENEMYDAIGEFANICNGLLATDLSARNISVDMEPPVTYLNQATEGSGYVIPFYINDKELKLFIAVDSQIRLGEEVHMLELEVREGTVDRGHGNGSVVIVDDSVLIRKMLRSIVEEMGYIVVGEAGNGADAVELYKKCQPDVLTLDITMPVMDGIEALKQIMDSDEDAKVVMITAAGQQSKVIQALKLGAAKFVMKPFDKEEVRKTLEEMMN